jgi:hypothetical protein
MWDETNVEQGLTALSEPRNMMAATLPRPFGLGWYNRPFRPAEFVAVFPRMDNERYRRDETNVEQGLTALSGPRNMMAASVPRPFGLGW